MRKNIILLSLLLIVSTMSLAQNKTLQQAEEAYKKGQINKVPDLLKPFDKKGILTKLDKIDAYKLLVNTYLYFNERDSAVISMTHFLELAPEYQIDPVSDHSEFVNLYNSFRRTPIYMLGLKAGLNQSTINVTKNFSLDNAAIQRGHYVSQYGFFVGAAIEIPIIKQFAIAPEFYFVQRKYGYIDNMFGFATIDFLETQTLLELPLSIKYTFPRIFKRNITPFVNIGVSASYLMGSSATIIRDDEVGNENQREIAGPSIDLIEQRNLINYTANAGLGVKLKDVLGRGYLILDFRYKYGLTNIAEPETRTQNKELLYDYLYMDNDFNMNMFSFSIGYLLPKYNPRLLKNKKQ